MQLEMLSKNETEIEQRIESVEKKQENVQRGLFRRFAELEKLVKQQQADIDNIKLLTGTKRDDYLF